MATASTLAAFAGAIHITDRHRIPLALSIDDIIDFDIAEFGQVFVQTRIDIGFHAVAIEFFQSIR